MLPEQKHTDSVSEKPADERRSRAYLLTDLPPEVLDAILLHALPDPTDLQRAFDPHVAIDLLTAPILRASRSFRHKCLALIRNTYLWIHVTICNSDFVKEFQDYNPYIPALPAKLHSLAAQNSVSVRLSFQSTSPLQEESRLDDTIILPFNFATLIQVCNVVNELLPTGFGESLTIECHNIHGHFCGIVQNLVAPVLTTLYHLSRVQIEGARGRELLEPAINDTPVHTRFWDLNKVATRASLILRRANELQRGGFSEESDMLFLHNSSFRYLAGALLPPPAAWSMGEVDLDTVHDERSLSFPGRCAKGNQLRRLLRQVDHHAALAYVNFATRYGWGWVETYRRTIGIGLEGFLAEPSYTWFGASETELADLHYERALIKEVMWKYRNKRDHRQLDKLYSSDAMLDMFFAKTLQPSNMKYQRIYEAYMEQLGDEARSAQEKAAQRLIIKHKDPVVPNAPGPAIWVGDRHMLDAWGGEDVLQYIPLAQRGLEISPNVNRTDHHLALEGQPRDS